MSIDPQKGAPQSLDPSGWGRAILCGVAVAALAAIMRTIIDRVSPGAAPFVFIAPAVLVSTLLAGWRAGAITLGLVLYLAWRHLLTPHGFDFSRPGDSLSFFLQALSGLLIVLVTEAFRAASRRELEARTERLKLRELLFRELDHRVKNTLALITSLVDIQRRRATDPAAQEALSQVASRLQSIAAAHRELYRGDEDLGHIDFRRYLEDLCRHLSGALFTDGVNHLETEFRDHVRLERDRAVALGLIVNELVTNAAKHARAERALRVVVTLDCNGRDCELVIADNGQGMTDEDEQSSGLGRGLIAALLERAKAEMGATNDGGARFVLRFETGPSPIPTHTVTISEPRVLADLSEFRPPRPSDWL